MTLVKASLNFKHFYMDIASLILPSLLIFLGGVISFIEKSKENKNEGKTNRFNRLGLLLVILGCVWAFWNGCTSQRTSKEANLKIDSINNVNTAKQTTIDSMTRILNGKQDTTINLQTKNFDTTNSILAHSVELLKSQKQNNDTTRSILAHSIALNKSQNESNNKQAQLIKDLTGSDNEPVLRFGMVKIPSMINELKYYLYLELFNKGTFPIEGAYMNIEGQYAIDTTNIIHYNSDGSFLAMFPDITYDKKDGSPFIIGSKTSKSYYTSILPPLIAGDYVYNLDIYWKGGTYHVTIWFHTPIDRNAQVLKYFFYKDYKDVPQDYFGKQNDGSPTFAY